jgi:L-alanine-DL-glutamate epimerase-like enolase superfamily enzyme
LTRVSALFDRIAGLDVDIDGVSWERLEFETPRWARVSTVICLTGGGHAGRGEDVSYATSDQDAHQRMDPPALSGQRMLTEWSAVLDGTNLFPVPPSVPDVRDYRRWAYESALLDLALRQAGLSFAQALGRDARPVRFCASPAGDPASLLARYPDLEVKIDAQADWSSDDMARIAATGRVRVVDLKGHYSGDWNRHPDDPVAFSAAVADAFPDVVIEDPPLGAAMAAFVDANAHRISFDAPVHSLADLLRLPRTGWCNIKPSRFATVERLLECIEHCERYGIQMYGGGQFEIGPGRAQIQAVAAALYPDGPNDVAPSGYNAASPADGLPSSPLPAPAGIGLGEWPRLVGRSRDV